MIKAITLLAQQRQPRQLPQLRRLVQQRQSFH
jgi:hypothetical protein